MNLKSQSISNLVPEVLPIPQNRHHGILYQPWQALRYSTLQVRQYNKYILLVYYIDGIN